MKFINILLVLVCFISMIGVSSAATYENGTLDFFASGSHSEVGKQKSNFIATTSTTVTLRLDVDDPGKVGTPNYFFFENIDVTYNGDWDNVTENVGGPFHIGPNGINGTGAMMIRKTATPSVVDIYIIFDANYQCTAGIYDFKVYTSNIYTYYSGIGKSSVALPPGDFGMMLTGSTPNDPLGYRAGYTGDVTLYNTGHFINDYSIYMDYSFGNFSIIRGAGGNLISSAVVIRNSTGGQIMDTGYASTDTYYIYANESAYYYIRPQVDGVEHLIYSNIADAPDFESTGTIGLNQTSYTDPELIQIDVTLTSYDFDDHIYRILMYYSDDAGSTWARLTTSLNASSILSSSSESRTSDISSGFYDLPIKIKAVLEDYDKTTTTSSVVATSSEVYYNPTAMYDYTFSGTVFDAGTGSPLEGATICATGATTTSDTSTVTGRFKLYLVDGTYTINCSKSGYVSNVNEDIVVWTNISLYNIYLTQTSYTNGTMNGIIKDADTDENLQDVHLIFTNATYRIDAYTSVGGYYTASGFEQSTSYDIRAIKSGYHPYNGSVTIEAIGGTTKSFDMVQINYSATPTETVLDTYPDGEGHAWTNDEIVTMLRIVVPGVFMMMFIFLLLAVLMGVGGNNGGNGGKGMGMKELWQR